MKIRFKLIKFEKRLAFEILEQIPIKGNFTFQAKNGIKIVAHSPHIDYLISHKHVYLRSKGRKEDDDRFSMVNFSTNEERDKHYDLVINAFKEFSNLPEDKF